MKPSIHTAVLGKDNIYKSFGINKINACLYGEKMENVVDVELSIAEDQTLPPAPQNDPKINEADYWAWYETEKEAPSLIWGKYFLLNMCFANGIKAAEGAGQGKAYRVNVKPVK